MLFDQDAVYVLMFRYLRSNNYFISKKKLRLQLLSHPEYPSLKAVTDTLDNFKIRNIAAFIPIESVKALPDTFLAVLKNGEISLVNRKKEKILLRTQLLKTLTLSLDEFQNQWSGTIVAVEKTKAKNSLKFLLNYLPLLILIIPLIIFLTSININSFLWIVLSIVGWVFSFLIIRKGFGLFDDFSQKICDSRKTNIDCNSVINSKSSKLFGLISLGDLCLVFFSVSFLTLSLIGFNYLFYLVVLSFSLPVIFYSIYEQAFVIKKWCLLCLSISTVILAMWLALFLSNVVLKIDFIYWRKALFISLALVVSWFYAKLFLKRYFDLLRKESKYLKFKRNFRLFRIALSSSKFINTDSVSKIGYGSSNPKILIDAVISPTCYFCKDSFKVYARLLDNANNDQIQVNFIFNVFKNDKVAMIISSQILNLYYTEGQIKSMEALKYWFNSQDINEWKLKYEYETTRYVEHVEKQTQWCDSNSINQVPLTILNNNCYPSGYETEDIFYFIEGLKS